MHLRYIVDAKIIRLVHTITISWRRSQPDAFVVVEYYKASRAMSQMGHQLRYGQIGMFALPPKSVAPIATRSRSILQQRDGPKSAVRTYTDDRAAALWQRRKLLDGLT